ncbi:hypothetical protein J7L13_01495 [bacterium]|nr:hypothetical protein [bacterium]
MTTKISLSVKFDWLKRWHKAALLSCIWFLISLIGLSLEGGGKFFCAFLLVLGAVVSLFWLEKRAYWKRRLAKYSLPFVLSVLTAGYLLIFPLSLFSAGVSLISALSFYFFASRLEIPLPYHLREEVTYYWLDLVVFWLAFLSFLVSYYFFFYLANLPNQWRFLTFSFVMGAFTFYLLFYSLWARHRHFQELLFYSLLGTFFVLQFLFVWGFFKMSPVGGSLLFVLWFYLYLESLTIFFRYQFIRDRDLLRILALVVILGLAVFFVFKPFTASIF